MSLASLLLFWSFGFNYQRNGKITMLHSRLLQNSLKIAFLFVLCFLSAVLGTGCHLVNHSDEELSTVRVMSYNIRVAAGPGKRLASEEKPAILQQIADVIIANNADLVLLQEVDRGTKRSLEMDQAAFLAEKTGLQFVYAPALEMDGGGEYGIALLSRWPITLPQAIQLYKPDYTESNPDFPAWFSEQRMALVATIQAPGTPMVVVNSHLGLTEDQRIRQVEDVAKLIEPSLDAELVLFGGDLNSNEPSELEAVRAILTDSFEATGQQSANTFPAIEPDRRIDYLFFGGDDWKVNSTVVLPEELSDHRAILVELSR
jgi:endonuclease/exonuclease/phosphatase family metal-dependent hydrolase